MSTLRERVSFPMDCSDFLSGRHGRLRRLDRLRRHRPRRRWRRPAAAADFGQPTASVTRWRVSALPSTPLPVPGVGRPRWQLELIRSRAGESADFEVEVCDAKGRLALPSGLVHGPAEKDIGRRRASG